MIEPTIEITADGKIVETIGIAASRTGTNIYTLRSLICRRGVEPAGHLDARTPLYLPGDIDGILSSRRLYRSPGSSA